ncbi:alpha/beta hydrolase [Bradyrhizobium sp. CCBAU 53338]|uniref:alpha/beta hydrolase n=1 Tax=Bradyrhizobium sp. CCBAU 53338 TaxID=1325111 RepID=UPI001889FE34|nr:alpha/beta hydrolase [Bradyrhizobium sp. CCBAU 53338]QOZ54057.1 alpha/beta hydrolase [Bradyrhizobium sp. CCBAU 53338]
MAESKTAPTFVLVHGAWADGSSWRKVIEALAARGAKAAAAPLPLTSVSDDIRALDRRLAGIDGPIVLVAHAYAGAVIPGSQNARVKGLVFVAALAPDDGETVGDVFGRGKPHPKAPQLAPDGDGFIWLPDSAFTNAFAQNASPTENALFAAVQRPIHGACLQEKTAKPLWKVVPSWYLLAEQDRMINPETQEFMAQRMKATIRRLDVDHTPIATAPEQVVELLLEAGQSVSV